MIVQGSREGPRLTEMVILSNIIFSLPDIAVDLRMRTKYVSLNSGRTRQVLGNAGADRKQAIYYWWPYLRSDIHRLLDALYVFLYE